MPLSHVQRVSGAQGLREIIFGRLDSLIERQPLRQMRSNGGGERAARSMRILRVYARGRETAHLALRKKHVLRVGARQMTALDQHSARALPRQNTCQMLQTCLIGRHIDFRQTRRLRQIGRDDTRQRKKLFAHGLDHARRAQRMA